MSVVRRAWLYGLTLVSLGILAAGVRQMLSLLFDLLVRGSLDAHGAVMTGCFWAPELHMIGGTLSILFMPCYGDRPDMWTGRASIIQLKKDSDGKHLDPAVPGNWTAAEHVVRADGSILNDLQRISLDMTYFEDSGRSYYAWQMLGSVFIATMDPAHATRLTSQPVRIIAPLYAWDNVIAEGPNVYVHGGKLFMLYSGSAVGDTYTTGLATATAGKGVDLTNPAAWTRLNYPIQKSGPYNGEIQLGTGHGMWSEDEDGNLLYVFHARTAHKGLTGRDMFVRRVHWASDGMPVLDMETDAELLPELRHVSVTVTISAPKK
jgi:GH43 family beta-xylosidase